MRSLIWAILVLGAAVSCAPLDLGEPKRPERNEAPQLVTVSRPEVAEEVERVAEEARARPVKLTEKDRMLTGKVTFSGFSAQGLADFRVIPEAGGSAFEPKNRRYPAVDGFWWKGDREKWFKIPNHAEAWVAAGAGSGPAAYDGSVTLSGFTIFWKSLPGLGWASALSGGVREPGFYPNAGRSRIGVGWPF